MNKSYYFENSNLISKNLRRLRKQQHLSQEELAAQMQLLGVDINQRLISKIELNQRFVYGDNVFEKCGIWRDGTGRYEKTRYFSGKEGIFNRDSPANRAGTIK